MSFATPASDHAARLRPWPTAPSRHKDALSLTYRLLTWTSRPTAQELLGARPDRSRELQRFVLNYAVMHIAATSDPALMRVFEALHFPLTTSKSPEFGELPITRIGINISTYRPSDALIIQSAELTGMDAFEEVVKVEEIAGLPDPLKQRLLEIARQQAPEIV